MGLRVPLRLIVIILILLFTGYGLISAVTPQNDEHFVVYVVQSYWHTGLILKTEEVRSSDWPEIEQYRDRKYIDIGWGDEKFYQVTGRPVFLAARAILWPTKSALQVYAFNLPLRSSYGNTARILKIPLNESSFHALCRFVSNSFKRDDQGSLQTSNVFGETDIFFLATRRYYLLRTCNTWMAKGFKEAGLAIRSCCVINANQLFRRLSRLPGAEFK